MIPVNKIFQVYETKFQKKVMPNEKISRGILNSEAFAFCALADYFKVDLVIESGICNGGSTEIWCKYFTKRTFLNINPVTAIDVKILPKAAIRLLSYRDHVTLVEANSVLYIPKMISQITNGTIAVFIDGPKNRIGVELAQKCLSFPQVKLVAIHDMCCVFYNSQRCIGRQYMDQWKGVEKFYTDNPEFIYTYKKLDGSFADIPHEKYIYGPPEKRRGYGPTVGLAWKGK